MVQYQGLLLFIEIVSLRYINQSISAKPLFAESETFSLHAQHNIRSCPFHTLATYSPHSLPLSHTFCHSRFFDSPLPCTSVKKIKINASKFSGHTLSQILVAKIWSLQSGALDYKTCATTLIIRPAASMMKLIFSKTLRSR